MSARPRPALFAAGALCCAGLSAALAAGVQGPGPDELDDLRPVLVTTGTVERGTLMTRSAVREGLAERRAPIDFAPPDALAAAAEAVGRRLTATLPPGSYLTGAVLASGEGGTRRRDAGPPRGTSAVEVAVTGAGPLAGGRIRPGARVDVVVSGAPGPGPGAGRAQIAAESVPLLALRRAPAQTGAPADRFRATLALGRSQALRLISAESAARSIRLLEG